MRIIVTAEQAAALTTRQKCDECERIRMNRDREPLYCNAPFLSSWLILPADSTVAAGDTIEIASECETCEGTGTAHKWTCKECYGHDGYRIHGTATVEEVVEVRQLNRCSTGGSDPHACLQPTGVLRKYPGSVEDDYGDDISDQFTTPPVPGDRVARATVTG